jgi:hypothetical protein
VSRCLYAWYTTWITKSSVLSLPAPDGGRRTCEDAHAVWLLSERPHFSVTSGQGWVGPPPRSLGHLAGPGFLSSNLVRPIQTSAVYLVCLGRAVGVPLSVIFLLKLQMELEVHGVPILFKI